MARQSQGSRHLDAGYFPGRLERPVVVDDSHLWPEVTQLIGHLHPHSTPGDDYHLDVGAGGCQYRSDRLDDEHSLTAAYTADGADARHDDADPCHRGRRLAAADLALR